MIHLAGHTIVGLGYDDTSSDLMYVHDTWDYNTYTMTWGGTYSGLQHFGVTIVQLAALVPPSVSTVDPGSGYRLQTLDVIITGTSFTGATTIGFGTGITSNSFTVNSATQITANITIAGDTTTGMRDVSVTTPDGSDTLIDGFEVTAPVGLLRVVTSPPVPTRIFLDGIPRNDWGLDWVKIPAGAYTLSFSDVPGYLAPISQPIEILPDTVTEVIASFTPLGNLRVETSPALPATIFANGNPMNDWGFWASLEEGEYTVSFQDMPGYVTPAEEVVTVNPGETTHVIGDYVPE